MPTSQRSSENSLILTSTLARSVRDIPVPVWLPFPPGNTVMLRSSKNASNITGSCHNLLTVTKRIDIVKFAATQQIVIRAFVFQWKGRLCMMPLSTLRLTENKPPKILPRLAHRAGLSPTRAQALWRKALREQATSVSPVDDSASCARVMHRWIALLEAESCRADLVSFGWRPWARANRQLWQWRTDVWSSLTAQWERQCRTMALCMTPH
jgi:hypothetical protein